MNTARQAFGVILILLSAICVIMLVAITLGLFVRLMIWAMGV